MPVASNGGLKSQIWARFFVIEFPQTLPTANELHDGYRRLKDVPPVPNQKFWAGVSVSIDCNATCFPHAFVVVTFFPLTRSQTFISFLAMMHIHDHVVD